jgi:hypothetical protein
MEAAHGIIISARGSTLIARIERFGFISHSSRDNKMAGKVIVSSESTKPSPFFSALEIASPPEHALSTAKRSIAATHLLGFFNTL